MGIKIYNINNNKNSINWINRGENKTTTKNEGICGVKVAKNCGFCMFCCLCVL